MKKFVALGVLSLGTVMSQAALTVTPSSIYSTVESNFDAAALIGVAVAGVIWGIRYIKRGLRAA
jgi:hypothetical protein